MNKKKIVNLVHEGYLEKNIGVYTALGLFKGIWYAVDLDTETIELEYDDNIRFIVDINSIDAIGYFEKADGEK